jgi:hypothetical protein
VREYFCFLGVKPLEAKELNRDRQRMTMMFDEQLARMRTHRNNIFRYRHLLQTKLTELEREFIENAPGRRAIETGDLGRLRLPDSYSATLRGHGFRGRLTLGALTGKA